MSEKENKQLSKLMAAFHKHDGGSEIEEEFTSKDPLVLKQELQQSFDSIFPELIKKTKHRKHVIFDDDVFKVFEELSQELETPFSSLINSALRSYAKDKMFNALKVNDPVAEFIVVREREMELLKTIKERKLTEELKLDLDKIFSTKKHG